MRAPTIDNLIHRPARDIFPHEIVDDEIEHEVGIDDCDASVFNLAHRAVLLAPDEDAFGHFAAGLVTDVAGGARMITLLRRLPALVRQSFCATCGHPA